MIRNSFKILDSDEIERRKPVWIALSDLWLDTEFEESDLRRIAGAMRESGYSVEELREIYLFEVAPVVFPNLLTVAGEWAGFDPEWLVGRVLKQARSRSVILRLLVRLGPGRWIMTYATEEHWTRLLGMLDAPP